MIRAHLIGNLCLMCREDAADHRTCITPDGRVQLHCDTCDCGECR